MRAIHRNEEDACGEVKNQLGDSTKLNQLFKFFTFCGNRTEKYIR